MDGVAVREAVRPALAAEAGRVAPARAARPLVAADVRGARGSTLPCFGIVAGLELGKSRTMLSAPPPSPPTAAAAAAIAGDDAATHPALTQARAGACATGCTRRCGAA